MTYLWINPVAASMYEEDTLNTFLERHGFRRFQTSVDWSAVVREKYLAAVKESGHTVIDMRCPKAAELVQALDISENFTFPDIRPILIHCGQEAAEWEEIKNEQKIITTPCQSLADMGNALNMENTHFIPWNRFLKMLGSAPDGKLPERSPIPPGFFSSLKLKTVSLSGEEEIRNYFESPESEGVQLAELLYCKDGCHNGDGIK